MKKNILLLFILLLFSQCNSQKKHQEINSTAEFQSIDQLQGKWYHIKKTIQTKRVTSNLEMQCSGKSFWEISKINDKYILSKHFATGKTCDIHIIKTSGLQLMNGNLNYLENDILKSEILEKLSNTKFKITEKSFINGEPIIIENFYEKK